MALDQAIMEAVSVGDQPPTLRLYAWEPYALSLGHAQSVSEIDLAALQQAGWGLVRRPTGGRAILHADELTYSLCARLEEPRIQGGVIESYRVISSALLLALEKIGLIADSRLKDEQTKILSKDPVCFQYPSDYEITFVGKKLVGSAQARRMNTLLQHGSIPLDGDITRILTVLKFASEEEKSSAREKLLNRAITVQGALGRKVAWREMADAMSAAFAERFNINFSNEPATDEETERVKQLLRNKYAHPEWTDRL